MSVEHIIGGALLLCAVVVVGILKSLRPEGPPYEHPRLYQTSYHVDRTRPTEAELRERGYITDIPDEPEKTNF